MWLLRTQESLALSSPTADSDGDKLHPIYIVLIILSVVIVILGGVYGYMKRDVIRKTIFRNHPDKRWGKMEKYANEAARARQLSVKKMQETNKKDHIMSKSHRPPQKGKVEGI